MEGFCDAVLRLLEHAVEENFVRPAHRELIVVEAEPAALIDRMSQHQAPHLHKWIDKDAL